MGRAQFDEREVVHAATNLFWQYGYQAVSMQDLVEGTGLNPGSLYLAFTNKEGLFAASLETYIAESCTRLEDSLADSKSVGKSLCERLEGMVDDATTRDFCSCFLVRAQLELAKDSDTHTELLQLVQGGFDSVKAIYREAIAREYGEDKAEAFASSLMLHIFGLRVYGYQNHSKEQVLDTLKLGLYWLPW
ncbi:MAG: TetR/AcrR family transcriptional regulator [Pseudomonadota bacterium]